MDRKFRSRGAETLLARDGRPLRKSRSGEVIQSGGAHRGAQHVRNHANGELQKDKTPEKTSVFRGLRLTSRLQITRPGLEQLPPNTGETAHSENGGHPGGQFGNDSESVASLKTQALDELQRAWKSLRRLEDLSDDSAESKAAGRAVGLLSKVFAELE